MNKKINAMTVDVEDYFHVAAFAKVIKPEEWNNWPSRVEQNTQRLLELFSEKKLVATFFILGWVAEKYPNLVKQITQEGHEIASHGFSHQLIYKQTPEVFKEETQRSKNLLEDLTGHPITGYRAASYSITHKSFWALDILAELGFEWDSSIFPIYHDNYGVASSPRSPYFIETNTGKKLLEFPMSTAKFMGQNLPASGGGYFRLFPYWLFQKLFSIASRDNPAIFYLHPWEVDPEQPRVPNASKLSNFRHYNNLDKCYSRLSKLIDNFSFGPVEASLKQYEASQLPCLTIDELDTRSTDIKGK